MCDDATCVYLNFFSLNIMYKNKHENCIVSGFKHDKNSPLKSARKRASVSRGHLKHPAAGKLPPIDGPLAEKFKHSPQREISANFPTLHAVISYFLKQLKLVAAKIQVSMKISKTNQRIAHLAAQATMN